METNIEKFIMYSLLLAYGFGGYKLYDHYSPTRKIERAKIELDKIEKEKAEFKRKCDEYKIAFHEYMERRRNSFATSSAMFITREKPEGCKDE